MILNRMAYGTGFRMDSGPWRHIIGGRAICPDGRVRSLAHVGEPDTVWTRPAAIRVRGRYVRGFVEIGTGSGLSVSVNHDPAFLRFIPLREMREAAFPGHPPAWVPPLWREGAERAAEAFAAWVSAGAHWIDARAAQCRVERDTEEAARAAYLARGGAGA